MLIFDINKLQEKEKQLKASIEQLEKIVAERQIQIDGVEKELISIKTQRQQEINNYETIKKEKEQEIKELNNEKEKLNTQISKRQDFFVMADIRYMDSMSGLEFEQFCCELLMKNGFKATVTKGSGDRGGDILAEDEDASYVIQCKKYSDKVGNKAIQEVYAAKGIYNAEKAIVMSNNYFTEQAITDADKLGVSLWNRDSIIYLIKKANGFAMQNLDNVNETSVEASIDYLYKSDREMAEELEDDETDPMLMDAIDVVVKTGQVSTSFIQRYFKVGYARAGRIIDQLEERGVISGYRGSKPRIVLLTPERLDELKRI